MTLPSRRDEPSKVDRGGEQPPPRGQEGPPAEQLDLLEGSAQRRLAPAAAAARGASLPLSGFESAIPSVFHFGAAAERRPAPELRAFPAPTDGPAKGLPYLSSPAVESCRPAWLEQISSLESRPGADLALLAEPRDAVLHGVGARFSEGAPPPRAFKNTSSYKAHAGTCKERLKQYEELGALEYLSLPPPPGGYPYVQPLHAVLKEGKSARVCVNMALNFNDYQENVRFSYSSVSDAVRLSMQLDSPAHYVKLDISSCFLSFPLRKSDYKYYVCHDGDRYLQFKRMVFGMKSAPRMASLLLDVVSSALLDAGVQHVRYLDDFLIVASTEERAWACAHVAAGILRRFGLALSPEKVEGPATRLEFLGVVIDSVARTLSISPERRQELVGLLRAVNGKSWVPLRRLQSLLGKLSFAASVLPGARPFMRRMIDVTRGEGRKPQRRLLLGQAFRDDVAYWLQHIDDWNGTAAWRGRQGAPFVFGSDASTDGFGYGLESAPASAELPAAMAVGAVRMGVWSTRNGDAARQRKSDEIQWGELFAPLAAAVEYGSLLRDASVVFVVDNTAVVWAINRLRGCKDPRLNALLRALCDAALKHNFTFSAEHRPGEDNKLMDWASRPDDHGFASNVARVPDCSLGERGPCSCQLLCARRPPLTRALTLSLLDSRCLTISPSGNEASWSPTCGGW